MTLVRITIQLIGFWKGHRKEMVPGESMRAVKLNEAKSVK